MHDSTYCEVRGDLSGRSLASPDSREETWESLTTRKIFIALIAVVAALCLYVDYTVVVEYYGTGPPYYGRTVDMDKWSNPVPILALVNGAGLAVAGLILKADQKLRRRTNARRVR
jgi:hypothetical protein